MSPISIVAAARLLICFSAAGAFVPISRIPRSNSISARIQKSFALHVAENRSSLERHGWLYTSSIDTLGTKRTQSSRRRITEWKSISSATADSTDAQLISNTLDRWLSRLTTAFPFFVLSAAILGLRRPEALLWVNRGSTVTAMLAAVMCGTGLTLQKQDFATVLDKPANRLAVPLGVACQFGIMPLTAYAVGKALLLTGTESTVKSALFLGLCLVGCSPGGTASNLVSLIAGADVALSVILTTCSTLAAVIMTPLLVKLLMGKTSFAVGATVVNISGMALCTATAKVVLLPVVAGMFLKARAPNLAEAASRFTPFASVLLVSLICGGVVAQTAPLLSATGTSAVRTAASGSAGIGLPLAVAAFGLTSAVPWASVITLPALFFLGNRFSSPATTVAAEAVGLPLVILSVVLLHSIGFALGYAIPKILYPNKEKTARTISIEVGMQNSALAVVLARSIPGIHPAASLPGALSATVHSCLGSILAAVWRLRGTPKDEVGHDVLSFHNLGEETPEIPKDEGTKNDVDFSI